MVATTRPSLFEEPAPLGRGSRSPHAAAARHVVATREPAAAPAAAAARRAAAGTSWSSSSSDSAEGNPFYIEELVTWLIDAGVIVKDEPTWRVERDLVGSVLVPSTLRGVLQARLDALSTEERGLLQRASVVGRVFWDEAVDSLRRRPTPVTRRDPDPGRAALPGAGLRAGGLVVRLRARVPLQARAAARRRLRRRAAQAPAALPRAGGDLAVRGECAKRPPGRVRRAHRRALRPGRRPRGRRVVLPRRQAGALGLRPRRGRPAARACARTRHRGPPAPLRRPRDPRGHARPGRRP